MAADVARRWLRRTVVAWAVLVLMAGAGLATARLGGWTLASVDSASMAPAVPKGALAVVRPVGPAEIAAGDVILFDDLERGITLLHRVDVRIEHEGQSYFVTKGDANDDADVTPVAADQVRGRMWRSIDGIGPVLALVGSAPGVFVVGVVLPLGLFGIDAALRRRSSAAFAV